MYFFLSCSPDSYRKLKKGCGWFTNVFGASDQEIMLSSGYNALFQMKFIKYLMIYFAICTVIGKYQIQIQNNQFYNLLFENINEQLQVSLFYSH
jgi:hypothetical protein